MEKHSFGSFQSLGISFDSTKTEQRSKDYDPEKVKKRRNAEKHLEELKIEKQHSDIFYE